MNLRIIAFLLVAPFSLFGADNKTKTVAALEFRPVVSKDTPGATPHVIKNPKGDEDVFLGTAVIIDAASVERAFAIAEGDPIRVSISIRLTATGQSAFGAYTQKHIGERIAIVVSGSILSAPIIREPILGDSLQVSGDFTYERAQEIARGIKPDSK